MEELIGLENARASAITALREPGDDRAAALLRTAAHEMSSRVTDHDTRPTASAWRLYCQALMAVAALREWVAAVRRAEPDGVRHLDSAHLLAAEVTVGINSSEPVITPIVDVLSRIQQVAAPSDVMSCAAALVAVPLPMPILNSPRQPRSSAQDELPQPRTPIAVAMFELDDEPAPDTALVQTRRFHGLELQLRLTDWPDWADRLRATALSIAGDSAQFPNFEFTRPDAPDDDDMWTVEGSGLLVIKAARPLGSEPITFVLDVELSSTVDGRRTILRTVGQQELKLWAMDDTSGSFVTGYPQLDKRLAEIFAQIWGNDAYGSDQERRAFMSFLVGLLRVTTVMQKHNRYPVGVDLDEKRFQADLLERLELRDQLAGRVQQGWEIGGGETDLVYENVVAELKVEKKTPVTASNAGKYLGQTTSYASGLGSQLGIAVVLDLSPKQQPVGTPANYMHWLEPKLHGVTDPKYPSHIAVLVINGNVPLPSSFAGKVGDVVSDSERSGES